MSTKTSIKIKNERYNVWMRERRYSPDSARVRMEKKKT